MDDLNAAFEVFEKGTQVTAPPPNPPATPEPTPGDDPKGEATPATPTGEPKPPTTPEPKLDAAPDPAAAPAQETPKTEDRFMPVNRHQEILNNTRAAYEGRIEEMKSAMEKAQAAPTPKNIESLQALREQLKEEAPEFVMAIVDTFERELVSRDEKIAKYEERDAQAAEDAKVAAQAHRDALLAQIPTLKEWETAAHAADATPEAKALWDEAVREERNLRGLGIEKWADPKVRFEKAMERAAETFGIEIQKPDAAAPAKPASPKAPITPKPLPGASVPSSLSQIPGGQPPPPPAPGFNGSFVQGLAATRGMSDAQSEAFWLGEG